MSLLNAENLCLRFGPRTILEGASFMISAGERVGVIGPNGTGKSTLFRVVAGRQVLDEGRLHFARGVSIGYLPQDILEVGEGPLLATVLAAVPGKVELETRLREVEADLHDAQDAEVQIELSQRLVDLHEQLDRFEAEYSDHEAERILTGLGFETKDFARPLTEFSGGWKMRAALAGLLFKRPDLLLLDEPTNHLDLPTVNWLHEFLDGFKHAILLISHDSHFLNRQVKRVLSFEVEGLRSYAGNYDQYRKLRDQEVEIRRAARRNQEAEVRQAEHFIRRFRAQASKARQVQSRIKKLEKIELVEVDHECESIRIAFPPTDRIGKIAIELAGLHQRFGDLHLYRGLDAKVERGDRIAVVGHNGAGKTTLLKIMAGELTPTEGEVIYGNNVQLSYYAQHQLERLDRSRTILDEVWRVNPSLTRTAVRTMCGAFLFSGDEVEKAVGVLSGGELARVSLAQLLVKPGNVLLMDEPTNHLDLLSAEALAETMETYDGTLVFVSHNRAFINRIANKVWDINHGLLTDYPGNLDEYLYHLKHVREAEEEESAAKPVAPPKAPVDYHVPRAPVAKEDNKARQEERRRLNRQRSQLERRRDDAREKIGRLEERIGELELRRVALEKDLAAPETYDDHEKYNALLNEYQGVKEKIDELSARWEHTALEIERLDAELATLSESV